MYGINGDDATGASPYGNHCSWGKDTHAIWIMLASQVGDKILAAKGDCYHAVAGVADILNVHHRASGLDEGDDFKGANGVAFLRLDGLEHFAKEVDVIAFGCFGVHEASHAINGELVGILEQLAALSVINAWEYELAVQLVRFDKLFDIVASLLLKWGRDGVLNIGEQHVSVSTQGACEQLAIVRWHKHKAAHEVRFFAHRIAGLDLGLLLDEHVAAEAEYIYAILVARNALDVDNAAVSLALRLLLI